MTIMTQWYLQVKHSKTSSRASYKKDFCQLIDIYTKKKKTGEKEKSAIPQDLDDQSDTSSSSSMSEESRISPNIGDGYYDDEDVGNSPMGKEMSVEYLENDSVDDWDGTVFLFYL